MDIKLVEYYQLIVYNTREETLSIDSDIRRRVREIEFSIKSERKDVENFLRKLKNILQDENFDLQNDFLLIKSKKEEMQYSTRYTLVNLGYDNADVVECLKGLMIKDYSETLIDKDDDHPPLLFVFGKAINNKLIYIKLKIKSGETKKVLCVSFHYAKWKMEFPYT